MGQTSVSQNLKALNLLRQAAREYNEADFKFYNCGFVKFIRENSHTVCIDDIYIEPEFRGTPIASMMLEQFEKFLKEEKILTYYGRVFHSSPNYKKRVQKFEKWGMKTIGIIDNYYTIVQGQVKC